MENEKRKFIADKDHQLRAVKTDDGKRFIEGFAIVFDHESRLIWDWEGQYHETVRAGAVDDVLKSEDLDVLALWNHNNDDILGRFRSGKESNTLALSVDDKALKYRIDVPDTTIGNDVFSMVERGDVDESSFSFRVAQEDQEWDFNSDIPKRTINKISGLFDVSVVWKGAYSDTDVSVAKRHFTEAKEKIENENNANENSVTEDIDEMTVRLHEIGGK